MKKITFLLIVNMLMPFLVQAQTTSKQLVNDFIKIEGTWKGSLTYLDYNSGQPYTMSADLEIKRIGKTNQFIFINTYPKEKSANSADTIVISKDGQYIGKEKLISRTKLSNGGMRIITEKEGKDGNDDKKATIRQIYTLDNTSFSKQKDVLFSGDTKWVKRHEYVYKKQH